MDENMSISNAEMKVMNHIWKTGAMITVPGKAGNFKRRRQKNGHTLQ